jgi:hypothetical protein
VFFFVADEDGGRASGWPRGLCCCARSLLRSSSVSLVRESHFLTSKNERCCFPCEPTWLEPCATLLVFAVVWCVTRSRLDTERKRPGAFASPRRESTPQGTSSMFPFSVSVLVKKQLTARADAAARATYGGRAEPARAPHAPPTRTRQRQCRSEAFSQCGRLACIGARGERGRFLQERSQG